MATNTWTDGGNDGNWTNTANWSLGAAPVNTNDIVINVGDRDITTNISATGITPNSLTVTPGFKYSIGTAGASLGFTGTVPSISISGTGPLYAINGGTDITAAVIDTPDNTKVRLTGGTWALVNAARGDCVCEAAAVVTALQNMKAKWYIYDNATAITTLTLEDDGFVNSYRAITTANVGALARLTVWEDEAVATANVRGILDHRSSGTITTATVFPRGQLWARNSPFSFTISTLNRWAGAVVDEAGPGGVTVTISSTVLVGPKR